MNPFIKSFEILWSDIDANRHLSNTSIMSYMVHTRMAYMESRGFGQQSLKNHQIGPVILKESINYLREVLPNERVHIDLELLGHSEDYRFFKFCHHMFKENREQAAYNEVLFGWMDLETRKLLVPPDKMIELVKSIPKATNFKLITKSDTAEVRAIPFKVMPA